MSQDPIGHIWHDYGTAFVEVVEYSDFIEVNGYVGEPDNLVCSRVLTSWADMDRHILEIRNKCESFNKPSIDEVNCGD